MMTGKLGVFCLSAFGVLAIASAYAGEYIPKSYYIISNGHKSEPVYLRSKRSVLHLLRKKREASYPGGNLPFNIPTSPEQLISQAQAFLNNIPHGGNFHFPAEFANAAQFQGGHGYGSGSGSGAYSFSSSSSGGPSGQGISQHHYSNTDPNGPAVFSRMGEERARGIQVSGRAAGANGAYSSSSSTSDGNGNVRYSVRTGKY